MKVIKYSVDKKQGTTAASGGGGSTVINTGVQLPDWFYYDGANVHCRYNFVGDLEVSAYAAGTDKIQSIVSALSGITENSTTAQIAQALIAVRDALSQ